MAGPPCDSVSEWRWVDSGCSLTVCSFTAGRAGGSGGGPGGLSEFANFLKAEPFDFEFSSFLFM